MWACRGQTRRGPTRSRQDSKQSVNVALADAPAARLMTSSRVFALARVTAFLIDSVTQRVRSNTAAASLGLASHCQDEPRIIPLRRWE
jgi:hypothetical protein